MSSKKIIIEKVKLARKINDLDDMLYNANKQIYIINNICIGNEFNGIDQIKKMIKIKRSSYKTQDTKKERYVINKFITYDELIEKLVVSKLKCNYCRSDLLILYKNVREDRQWTLDRIDNSMGHTNDNCVISCLRCNLQKGTRDDYKFKFTKQMNIIKIN
jgi:5-methylcytosine-specific restriction endonuclease McrA